ncbi:hypothetical protein SBBP2_880007 [Burkholderiales bacterium]|nr:hypothetical protein SBBP2_880007 [Burkholderiales bacterium]
MPLTAAWLLYRGDMLLRPFFLCFVVVSPNPTLVMPQSRA